MQAMEKVNVLHGAVEGNDYDGVVGLLRDPRIRSLIDSRDAFGETALGYAVSAGNAKMVSVLLGAGANVNGSTGNNESSPLLDCALKGDPVVCALLLAVNGILVNRRGISGLTPLIGAVEGGSVETVRLLLDFPGIGLTEECPQFRNALHHAAERGEVEMCVELLLAGADKRINRMDWNGDTALTLAAHEGNVRVCEVLVGVDMIDLFGVNDMRQNALAVAATRGNLDICRLLAPLYDAAHVNTQDSYGMTSLHRAALYGHAEVLELLLGLFGTLVNEVDRRGNSALHHAAVRGNEEAVRVLLRTPGVLVDARNSEGLPAIVSAMLSTHSTTSCQLLLLGAPGIDKVSYVQACIVHRDMECLLLAADGRLDLRGMGLLNGILPYLENSLGDSLSFLDIRDNPGLTAAGARLPLEAMMDTNPGLLAVRTDLPLLAQECATRQNAFLSNAKVYLEKLRNLHAQGLSSEQIAEIGALGYAEHFVYRGANMYERARALIYDLLK
jgi:ankyrin repeat protein